MDGGAAARPVSWRSRWPRPRRVSERQRAHHILRDTHTAPCVSGDARRNRTRRADGGARRDADGVLGAALCAGARRFGGEGRELTEREREREREGERVCAIE